MFKDRIISDKLFAAGDYFTAGFFGEEDPFIGALTVYLKNAPLPEYNGERVYPLRPLWFNGGILNHDYSYTLRFDEKRLEKSPLSPEEKTFVYNAYRSVYRGGGKINLRHALAGRGYTHFCPETDDFINMSLTGYLARYRGESDFNITCGALADALIYYVNRVIAYLSGFEGDNAERLVAAYKDFLVKPAKDFFGAFIRIAFIFAFDGYDSLANVDASLKNFDLSGDESGLFSELYASFERYAGWNFSIGLSESVAAVAFDGFCGSSRPNISFKVGSDTSDSLWESCFKAIERGMRPAFYNRDGYEKAMKKVGVKNADLKKIGFGGCTETMIAGRANVGSIDAGINFAEILTETVESGEFDGFESLLCAYLKNIEKELDEVIAEVNADCDAMRSVPQYVRTLLCPPCAEYKKNFNDGGAEYYFSVINLCALANAADGLYAMQKLVFEQKKYAYIDVVSYLKNDFAGADSYLSDIKGLKFFGNDNDEVDLIAKKIFSAACEKLENARLCIKNGRFLPACIMFNTALKTGENTRATPDGRKSGLPVADSGGAMTGRDVTAPTALLNSIGNISPMRAAGTWVVNVALSNEMLLIKEGKTAFKALIGGFFDNCGCQVQINVIDKKLLLAAVDDDELAKTIIVRVGGFSERFCNLSKEFRKNIAERTVYR
ncbi:MAG: hypothetical protein J5762_05365 [Clostridia bacterium]|nr:hypothetical protein [Clostridia bacterium]